MIVAGFGFRASVRQESLTDAFQGALADAGGGIGVASVATASDKAENAVFRAFAASLSARVHGVDQAALEAQKTLTRSGASQAARGTGSVAEAAALAAIGAGGRLLGPRVVSRDGLATCALAERGPE